MRRGRSVLSVVEDEGNGFGVWGCNSFPMFATKRNDEYLITIQSNPATYPPQLSLFVQH
jgi:hypothetical protein